jgi:xanthine dehydrogenase accessory factor
MGAQDRQVLFELTTAVEAGRPVVLATVVETRRSAPRRRGTKMLVFGDGETFGTIGGGEMESRVIAASARALSDRHPQLLEYALVDPTRGDPGVCGGEVKIYLEPYMPRHTVYVIGCGHVGRAVVDLAHWLGYRTVAIDDREDMVSPEVLANADQRVVGSLNDLSEPVPEDASIVLVTRNIDLDVAVLPEALATPARYIGVMGSTTRWRTVSQNLVGSGVAPADLDRVHSPIGLEMNAETLEEIAVSIMSEIIQVNRSVPFAAESW